MQDPNAPTYTALGAPGVTQPFGQLRNAPAPMAPFGGVSPSQQAAVGQHFGNLTSALAGPGQTQAQLTRANLGQQVGQGLYGVGLGAFANQIAAAKPWLGFMGGLAGLPFNAMPDMPDIELPGFDDW